VNSMTAGFCRRSSTWPCGRSNSASYRREVVAAASGRVLEVGVGSGLNLPLFGRQVEMVHGIDPSPRLLAMARVARGTLPASAPISCRGLRRRYLLQTAASKQLVMTWTLCSIADPSAALREMRRVLKAGGKLVFVEHGLSPEPASSAGSTG